MRGNEESISSLQSLEKKLVDRLQLVELLGKGNRKGAVLLTEDMVKAIDCLNDYRASIEIPESPSSQHLTRHLGIWQDGMPYIRLHNLTWKPELVTTTSLRKYITTAS